MLLDWKEKGLCQRLRTFLLFTFFSNNHLNDFLPLCATELRGFYIKCLIKENFFQENPTIFLSEDPHTCQPVESSRGITGKT